jgi:SOS response regulatory protein OraA/RecX
MSDNGEKVHERADSEKVRHRIYTDSKQAVEKTLKDVSEGLVKRGFDAKEINPIIREGADDASYGFRNK